MDRPVPEGFTTPIATVSWEAFVTGEAPRETKARLFRGTLDLCASRGDLLPRYLDVDGLIQGGTLRICMPDPEGKPENRVASLCRVIGDLEGSTTPQMVAHFNALSAQFGTFRALKATHAMGFNFCDEQVNR